MGRAIIAIVALTAVAGAEPSPSPSVPAESRSNTATLRYDKGFVLASGDGRFDLKLGLRGQFRLEVLRPEGDDEFESRFLIPRLRLQFEGHAFGEDNLYKVEFDMANKGSAALKDFFLEHAFLPGLRLRVGQWKRPFNRQEMVSDFGSEFLERSISNEFAGGGRDLGAAVHNGYEKSPDGVEWALGVFNSTGDRARQSLTCDDPTDPTTCDPTPPTNVPADFGPIAVARVGWNHGGIKGYSEGDLEGGPLRVAVGASYKVNFNDLQEGKREDGVEIDTMAKLHGLGVSGAFFILKKGSADRLYGFYVQPGYFVVPKRLELAARFAQIDDEEADGEHVHEVLGAIDWYFDGHSFKWMTDGGVIHHTEGKTSDVQVRTQLQMVF